jgi:ectoine hydroxylase-related dioxygenase (phytanoyl-CoA dioxygenase family)
MNPLPVRPIADAERAAYARDGVVMLAGMFDADWIARLCGAIDRDMARPSAMATDFNAPGTPGRFFGDMFMWTWDADFRAAVFDSPAPAIAAALMGAARVHFFYDQLFVKEPGTTKPTPWHQDQPYWAVAGEQICTVWIALDRIPIAAGAVEYVAGSHRWDRRFRPVAFREGNHNAVRYAASDLEPVPDIEAERAQHDIRAWTMAPGDCLVFHAKIMHGAPGNATAGRRRGLALRFTGDDARYDPRPGTFQMIREPELPPGAPMECDLFPRVWPRPPVRP